MDENLDVPEQKETNRLEPEGRAGRADTSSRQVSGSEGSEARLVTSSPTGKQDLQRTPDSQVGEPSRTGSGISREEAEAIRAKALEILREETATPILPDPLTNDGATAEGARAAGRDVPRSEMEGMQSIPARMLNEFVYCQRLFYYEFVEGVFVESADTLRGAAIHQRVDTGSGAMPDQDKSKVPPSLGSFGAASQSLKSKVGKKQRTESSPGGTRLRSEAMAGQAPALAGKGEAATEKGEETIHSRSVQMGSERLGVVAKMDLVEVRPMESKVPPALGSSDAASSSLESKVDGPESSAESLKSKAGEPGGKENDGLAGGEEQEEFTEQLFRSWEVCPVDYKAGAPREGKDANELWDTDKMQLGLQALILRDNGYTCEEGIIYYRATKQRVRLRITAELEQWILENIAEARRVAIGPMPAPLVSSPKCVRCSLAPVCLPDETRLLGESLKSKVEGLKPADDSEADTGGKDRRLLTSSPTKTGEMPRRLIASRDDTRPLYLNTQGLRVGCREEVLQVKDKERVVEEIRIRDVSHVALFGNIQISTQAIQALCEQEVPVTYFSMGGWFYGITRGHEMKNVFLRMEQFRLARDETACLGLARQIVHGKIRNHRTMIMRNHVEPPEPAVLRLRRAAEDALAAGSLEELLGIEGAAASLYFQEFGGMIKLEDELDRLGKSGDAAPAPGEGTGPTTGQGGFTFNFNNRNRRPPVDPVNAMLSLAYSLLTKDCTLAALAVGFDPYVGFYHQPRFGRPALGLDLVEEFRPLIAESTVLNCINNRVVTEKDFVKAGQAVNLSAAGRKRFFQIYEQRMSSLITHPLFDYKVSYRRALELQARLLAKALTGEIPEYVPLLTR